MRHLTPVWEVIASEAGLKGQLQFDSWAVTTRFKYDQHVRPVLRRCGSAAEAYLIRAASQTPGMAVDGDQLVRGGLTVAPQKEVKKYFLDVAVEQDGFRLAVEVDGQEWHRVSEEQAARDMLRQRRITAAGWSVIRFTAREVFGDAQTCWTQVEGIIHARTGGR